MNDLGLHTSPQPNRTCCIIEGIGRNLPGKGKQIVSQLHSREERRRTRAPSQWKPVSLYLGLTREKTLQLLAAHPVCWQYTGFPACIIHERKQQLNLCFKTHLSLINMRSNTWLGKCSEMKGGRLLKYYYFITTLHITFLSLFSFFRQMGPPAVILHHCRLLPALRVSQDQWQEGLHCNIKRYLSSGQQVPWGLGAVLICRFLVCLA